MLFTQIEAVKAYLFANSEFLGEDWDTKIARDIFLGRIDAWYLSRKRRGQC